MYDVSISYTEQHGYKIVKSFFEDLCSETQSPFSEKALKLSREGKDWELSRLDIRPSDYVCPYSFRADYLIKSFLSKWKGLKTGIDTKAAALLAFRKQEELCKAVNSRLRSGAPALVDPIIHRAQRLIARLLGEFKSSSLDGLERWGPGSTTDLKRSEAYLDTKMSVFPIPVTRDAAPLLAESIAKDLHWSYVMLGCFPEGPYSVLKSNFRIVAGSRIDTVPKNAKTDRTIAIEPRGNMWLQKAVGTVIRRKLRRVGIDLDDQSVNQRGAKRAQEHGLATIDLSMASDSVTTELVYQLLPVDWAIYLDRIRSKSFTFDGFWSQFEKFSSMGNGFTFELESLIFWALAKASCEDERTEVLIYGDDIILPQSQSGVLISTLAWAGFETNVEKSFVEGSFYESCGRHYFDGIDVTPVYQKELVLDEPERIRFLNRVARFLIRNASDDALVAPGSKTWRKYRSRVSDEAPALPFGVEGDGGYLVNHSLDRARRARKSYGLQWTVTHERVGSIPADDAALLAYSLRKGVKTESPYMGMLDSRVNSERHLSLVTRWIEPPWEYALD